MDALLTQEKKLSTAISGDSGDGEAVKKAVEEVKGATPFKLHELQPENCQWKKAQDVLNKAAGYMKDNEARINATKEGHTVIDLNVDFKKVDCPRRLWQQDENKIYFDVLKGEWEEFKFTRAPGQCLDGKCVAENTVCVRTQVWTSDAKIDTRSLCECVEGYCAFNNECVDRTAWINWGKILVHAAGQKLVSKHLTFYPKQAEDKTYLVVKNVSGLLASQKERICADEDPWTREEFFRTVDEKPEGFVSKTCKGALVLENKNDCACPSTGGKGDTGCAVKFKGKMRCIKNEDWPILFERWLLISRDLSKVEAISAKPVGKGNYSGDCERKSTRKCGEYMNKCPDGLGAVCASDTCQCNQGRCALDTKLLYDEANPFQCLDYEQWLAYGEHLAKVVHGTLELKAEGSREFQNVPARGSFATGLVAGCDRTIPEAKCGNGKLNHCHYSRHAFCNSQLVCACNVDDCAFQGRCIDYAAWHNIATSWTKVPLGR